MLDKSIVMKYIDNLANRIYCFKDGGFSSQDGRCRSQLAASVEVGNSFPLKRNSMNRDEYLDPSDTSSVGSYEKSRLCQEDIELIAEATSSKVFYRMQAHALKLHAKKLRWLTKKY